MVRLRRMARAVTALPTRIRASMLPGYADCARRGAIKQWRHEIEDVAGHKARDLPPSIGATVGTAVHAAAAHALTENPAAALEIAMSSFATGIAGGAVWDDTTPSPAIAEQQIARMVAAYVHHVAPSVRKVMVEQLMSADLGDGFELAGTVDLIVIDGTVRDLKTGARPRPYQAQVGAYALLARSQKPNPLAITGCAIDFIRRTPVTKRQDMPATESYDRRVAENAAWHTTQRIKADLIDFRRSGELWSFPANPMSQMCTDRYCPAHGTRLCSLWRTPS